MAEPIASLVLPGMMVLAVCSADRSDLRGEVIIDPDHVVIIYHSRDTPDGCVKIAFKDGRGVFVVGDEVSVAEQRTKALREKHSSR